MVDTLPVTIEDKVFAQNRPWLGSWFAGARHLAWVYGGISKPTLL